MIEFNELLRSINAWLGTGFDLIALVYDAPSKIFEVAEKRGRLKLIIKLYPATRYSFESICKEQELLNFLSRAGVPCIAPYSVKKPQRFTLMGTEYFGMVTHKADGQPDELTGERPEIMFLFGRALKDLHERSFGALGMVECIFSYSDWLPKINRLSKDHYVACLKGVFDDLLDVTGPTLPAINKSTAVICHGDAWPGNAIYQPDFCTLLDFEYAIAAPPVLDIATFLWWVLGFEYDQRRSHWEMFKKGYGESIENCIEVDMLSLVRLNELRSITLLINYVDINQTVFEVLRRRVSFLVDINDDYNYFLENL